MGERQATLMRKKESSAAVGKKRHPARKALLIVVLIIAVGIGLLCAWVPIQNMALRAKYVPEFQTVIAPFAGEAYSEPLPEQVASMDLDPDVTVNKLFVNGIPLYECYKDDGTQKPLIIVMHDSSNTKEAYVGEAAWYASMGYYALTVDEDGCGENESDVTFLKAYTEATVYEIDTLIEYYNGVEQADAADFSLTGASQGGHLCYYYGEYGKYKPYAIMPMGGSVHDTIRHPERFLDVYILCGMGAEDDRCVSVREFEERLTALGGGRGIFRYYEGLRHEDLLPDYYDERNAFLEAHLTGRNG